MPGPSEDHLSRLLLHIVIVVDCLPVDEVGVGALERG